MMNLNKAKEILKNGGYLVESTISKFDKETLKNMPSGTIIVLDKYNSNIKNTFSVKLVNHYKSIELYDYYTGELIYRDDYTNYPENNTEKSINIMFGIVSNWLKQGMKY